MRLLRASEISAEGQNEPAFIRIDVTLTPALIAQGTTAEQTFTATGVRAATDTLVMVEKPTLQAGLGLASWRISADDQIGIGFANIPNAGGNITPTAGQKYKLTILRARA